MSPSAATVEKKPRLGRQILKSGVGSALTKGFSLALSFAVSIVLARALGPEEFGLYSFVIALASILAVPPQFGLPALILRETGRALAKEDYGRLLGSWQWSGRIAVLASVFIAVLAVLAALLLGSMVPALRSSAYYWSLLLIPFVTLGALRGAALVGLGKVVQGLLPELVLVPGLFVVFLGAIWLYAPAHLGAGSAMAAHAAAAGIAFFIGVALLYRGRPAALKKGVKPIYESENWRRSAIPMAVIMGVGVVVRHTDIVMVGLLSTDERVGVYRIAAQWSLIVALGAQIIGFVTPPYFARFHALGDKRHHPTREPRTQTLGLYARRIAPTAPKATTPQAVKATQTPTAETPCRKLKSSASDSVWVATTYIPNGKTTSQLPRSNRNRTRRTT